MKPPQIKRKHFELWLEKQPDGRRFDYESCVQCLLCHYFKDTFGLRVWVKTDCYCLLDSGEYEPIPLWMRHNLRVWSSDLTIAKKELLGKEYEDSAE